MVYYLCGLPSYQYICMPVRHVYIFFSTLTSFCLHLQSVDFEAHFSQAEKDIKYYIPDEDFPGYAVIGKYNPLKFYLVNFTF